MELYGFMEREKKIPSYFFIITKEIPMIQQMDGTAEIVTEEMRLISRFFNPIISIFKN